MRHHPGSSESIWDNVQNRRPLGGSIYLVLEKHDNGMMFKVKRIGDSSEDSCRNLHRSMLYPFMSVHGEESDEEGREVVCPPSKSLSVNTILQEANLEMESHFGILIPKII